MKPRRDKHLPELEPVQEQEIQKIFDESRKNLPEPASLRTRETIRKARHQAGLADSVTLVVRTGKVSLHLLELLFRSKGKPVS